jgi:hypothetical protein
MKKIEHLASDTERALIERWLERCDIVKYGGLKAAIADAKQTLEDARALVVTTSQMPLVNKVVAKEAPKPPVVVRDPNKSPYAPPDAPSSESPYAPPASSKNPFERPTADEDATTPYDKSSDIEGGAA